MKKKIIYIISILAIITILLIPTIKKETELTLWTNNSENKKEIIKYIKNITNEKNKNYIPEEDRIAVFDLDGTLYCETDPIYLSWKMYANKIQNESQEKAQKILKKEIPLNEREKIMSYKDMTIEEYEQYINEFISKEEEGYANITRKQAFYKPMLELIEYLQKNKFTIYINSGSDYYLIKNLIKDVIIIPETQIIGTELIIIDNKITGEIKTKNLNQKKVENIKTTIGKQPVLAFGNSSGDYEMLNYVNENNKYKTQAFIIVNDDNIRENGNEDYKKVTKQLKEKNIKAISMKNEWTTIYGKNVKKKM